MAGSLRRQASIFFLLKKKKQKDFCPFPLRYPAKVGKVFWFFFSKKNNLSSFLPSEACAQNVII